MPLSPGAKLGPYEIVARLGAGGMGEVWKALDTRLNRIVAIKQINGAHSARFEHEARAIAALNHPHICQIHDVGPDYLVLEYVEGKPLQGPMSAEQALPLARQIAGALETAHKRGILHRDLKPGNVIVTESGAKLLDFGLAKLTADSDSDITKTVEGAVLGTPAYLSPEQAQGKTADTRSDIFSFGAILYELLSGKRAFPGESIVEVLSAVTWAEPAPLPPSDLARVAMHCLRKTPADRYQSMADVRTALEHGEVQGAGDRPSIAVLPLTNMSHDPNDEFFSDGLAEEIINALTKVPGLKVIARTSAFAFKGQNTDIRKIAGVLGVSYILEGSVRRAGSRIRVTAQLISATDGAHLWSDRYDRQMDDLFAMQDEIAAAIAGELKLKFAPNPAPRPRRQPNLQAYESYLRYLHHQWGLTPDSLRLSRECLEKAIALDPGFALPYAGLADHHLASTLAGAAAHEVMPIARDLALRALDADPDLPEGHGMLGIVAGNYEFNWKEAERRFQLAMASTPVPWHVRQWHSYFLLLPTGREREALEEARRTLEDDPLSQVNHMCLGTVAESLGMESEAREAYTKTIELDPNFWWGWWCLGTHLAVHGAPDKARRCAERASAIFPSSPLNIGLAAGLLEASKREEAESLLSALPADSIGKARFCFHLVRHEINEAVHWANALVSQRDPVFFQAAIRSYQWLLRPSAGWLDLMKAMNLA